jgi:hypothetical protein
MPLKTIFSSLLILCLNLLQAQHFKKTKNWEIAIGPSIIHEKLPEGYDYHPLFITARMPIYSFFNKRKTILKAFVEPQFVLNFPKSPFKTSYELGMNAGLQYAWFLSSKNSLAISLSAGPHFLSLETAMQAKGFIFSDNIEIAYYHLLGKGMGFSLKPRFRHISNAGLQSPNIGIDNLFLMVGFFWRKD